MEFLMKEVGFHTTTEYGELHVALDEDDGYRPSAYGRIYRGM